MLKLRNDTLAQIFRCDVTNLHYLRLAENLWYVSSPDTIKGQFYQWSLVQGSSDLESQYQEEWL